MALICAAAWLRSFGIGLLGVVLGVFLYREGLSTTAIGMVIAAGLAGAAAATAVVTIKADRLGRRRTLFALSLLTALGALPLVFHAGVPLLAPIAFVGMLNGMGTDRSAAFALEQAVIPGLVSDQRRTWSLAWYSVVLDSSGALGALAAGIPFLEHRFWGIDLTTAYQTLFAGYVVLNLFSGVLYLFLTREVEIAHATTPGREAPVMPLQKFA